MLRKFSMLENKEATMGATVNGGGDQLARGAVRVQFRNASGVSKEKYNEATQDFDLDKFLGREPAVPTPAPKRKRKTQTT